MVLNTRPTSGASTGAGRSAGEGNSSTIFLSSVRRPYVCVALPQKSGTICPASIAFFTAPMNCSRGISSPGEIALDQVVVGGGDGLGQVLAVLLVALLDTPSGMGTTSFSPFIAPFL